MMMPRRNGLDIFDEVFNDPFFSKKETKLMKTDVKEVEGNYQLEIDVPGYEKEDIKIELEDGYITVTATTNTDKTQKNGKYIQRERFSGVCSRSYYAGENINEDDIKANFKNGTLIIRFPKNIQTKAESKKYIQIGD